MVAHISRNDVIVHKNYLQNNNYSQEYVVESAFSHKNSLTTIFKEKIVLIIPKIPISLSNMQLHRST